MRSGFTLKHALVAMATLGTLACEGGSTGTTGGTTPSPVTGESMAARISGASWTAASSTITGANISGVITISGAESGGASGRTITLMAVTNVPGTFAIGQPPIVSSGASAVLAQGSAQWSADTSRGSGTITIASLTADGVTGTFAFEAQAVPGTTATSSRSVTEGAFNARF